MGDINGAVGDGAIDGATLVYAGDPLALRATSVSEIVEAWLDRWYPESAPANHPAPYLSGAWHHARRAADDLIERL
jgi:hypothetical protein